MKVAIWAVGIVITAVVTAVVTLLVTPVLQSAAIYVIGGALPSRHQRLKGRWRSDYSYIGEAGRRWVFQMMEIYQVGSHVVARNVGGDSPHKHHIRARVEGPYLTGFWYNAVEGARHWGAFQLAIRPDGRLMKGKWIGFDRTQNVQHGDFEWSRQSDDIARSR